MIERLKIVSKPEDLKLPVDELEMRCLKNLLLKVDELVDAVNRQQTNINNHECRLLDLQNRVTALDDPTYQEIEPESADPYAEQRKWIGKLCRFWDDNCRITKHFGILTRIDETAILRYEAGNGFWYCDCEPVKPDDDIIYKGGDNE